MEFYPVRPLDTLGAPEAFEVDVFSAPHELQMNDGAAWSLTTTQGQEVDFEAVLGDAGMRRTRLSVDWEALEGVEALILRDHDDAEGLTLPLFHPTTQEELMALVDRATCGLVRTRVAPERETVEGVITLWSADNHVFVVPPEAISLEVEGGFVMSPPMVNLGLKDMTFSLRVGAELGPGRVIVRSSAGELWGECGFLVEERPEQAVDVEASWATISKTTLTRGGGESARLRVGVINPYGELLGADVWPTVTLQGAEWFKPLAQGGGGSLHGDLIPHDDASTVRVTVTLQGQIVESFVLDVVGEPVSEPEAPADAGCASGSGAIGAGPLALLLGLFIFLVASRSRRGRGGRSA